ncbi:hypothetical protein EDB81DRAFT_953140, partial [Dactylonectria macrodidyma]
MDSDSRGNMSPGSDFGVHCPSCNQIKPASDFISRRKSANQTITCLECRDQRDSERARSKGAVLTLRNLAVRPSSAERSAPKRTDGDAGLSPPNERSGTQPASPLKPRQLHTARRLFEEPISQPHVVLGTPGKTHKMMPPRLRRRQGRWLYSATMVHGAVRGRLSPRLPRYLNWASLQFLMSLEK